MRVAFSCCKVRVGLCFSLEVQPLLFFFFVRSRPTCKPRGNDTMIPCGRVWQVVHGWFVRFHDVPAPFLPPSFDVKLARLTATERVDVVCVFVGCCSLR